jgi:BirA family biotin operon repressor/biotin-[acetyl-CoA-carboxylase] ligase
MAKGYLLHWNILEYESIDSTNLEARRLLSIGAVAGFVVWAHHQTAGRGRLDREWLDLPGKSLMVSLILKDHGGFRAGMLAALSIRAAIRGEGGEGPLFKWPNDLVYGWKKAGGILSESCRAGGKEHTITGLGLNIGYLPGELDFPTKLPATSLLIEEKKIWDIKALLLAMLKELDNRLSRNEEELLEEYRTNLAYLGQSVRINPPLSFLDRTTKGGDHLDGILDGIDNDGNLVVRVGDEILRVVSGDIARSDPVP